jgi:hypothetical protein
VSFCSATALVAASGARISRWISENARATAADSPAADGSERRDLTRSSRERWKRVSTRDGPAVCAGAGAGGADAIGCGGRGRIRVVFGVWGTCRHGRDGRQCLGCPFPPHRRWRETTVRGGWSWYRAGNGLKVLFYRRRFILQSPL